jgi:hypothetical protein
VDVQGPADGVRYVQQGWRNDLRDHKRMDRTRWHEARWHGEHEDRGDAHGHGGRGDCD